MSDLLIICHHGVSESWPTDFAISPERLERQLRQLLRRGYRPMTLASAVDRRPAGKVVVVTFDDACRSVLREGYPILAQLGVPATVFVPTAFATEQRPMDWMGMRDWMGTRFEAELECMSWQELRRLRDEGWEIGSHTRRHLDLTALDDAEVAVELNGSREDCEGELGEACSSLAYPYSSYDDRVKRMTREAGYRTAVILDSQIAVPRASLPFSSRGGADPFELLRAGIYRHDGWPRFLLKTSRTARRVRASGPWHRVARAASSRRS